MIEQERFFSEQGRGPSASALARAERWAKKSRVYYSWRTEQMQYRDEKGAWQKGSATICRAYKLDEKYPFATRSSIVESNDPIERANYRRVVEAELALGATMTRPSRAFAVAKDAFAVAIMTGSIERAKENARSVPQRAHELITKWRAQAQEMSTNKGERKSPAETLLTCANELESIVRDVGWVTQPP